MQAEIFAFIAALSGGFIVGGVRFVFSVTLGGR